MLSKTTAVVRGTRTADRQERGEVCFNEATERFGELVGDSVLYSLHALHYKLLSEDGEINEVQRNRDSGAHPLEHKGALKGGGKVSGILGILAIGFLALACAAPVPDLRAPS